MSILWKPITVVYGENTIERKTVQEYDKFQKDSTKIRNAVKKNPHCNSIQLDLAIFY